MAFLMELGRWDFTVRCSLLRVLLRERYFPVMAAQTIRYLRPMRRLRRYEVQTRVVSWDERFFFIEHRVERDGKLYAVGLFRGLFKSGATTVPAERLFKELGASVGAPPVSPAVERWKELDGALLPADP